MAKLVVGIGEYEYQSLDGGVTWEAGQRDTPAGRQVDVSLLPPAGERMVWTFLKMLDDRFGLAVKNEQVDQHAYTRYVEFLDHVYLTNDGGASWVPCDLEAGLGAEMLGQAGGSWPVECFSDLFLLEPSHLALFWEDPWLFHWPDMHLLHSHDRGETWAYACLGEPCPVVSATPFGRLLAMNTRRTLESFDFGVSWSQFEHEVVWPADFSGRPVALPRHVTFLDPDFGYGLVVHWPREDIPHCTPEVGLVRTDDGGHTWSHIHVFQNCDTISVNSPGVLSLALV